VHVCIAASAAGVVIISISYN